MINSQLPYNQLPPLSEVQVREDQNLRRALDDCRSELFQLNGYLDAQSVTERESFCRIMKLLDAKYSFDLEAHSLALPRLFEAWSSENQLGDARAKRLFDFLSWYETQPVAGLSALEPVYLPAYKKPGDLIRERREIRIKSYYTNLTLYTAPVHSARMQYLRNDLNNAFERTSRDAGLLSMCLCHFQLRALAPFTESNGHIARTYSKLFLKDMGLLYDVLPISQVILRRKETYNALVRETADSGLYLNWSLFLLKVVRDAASQMLERLKQTVSLRKKLTDQLLKYDGYNLPAGTLARLLCERPFIKPAMLTEALSCHRQTAYVYLEHLVKMGILTPKLSGRERLYMHRALLDIFSD